MLNTCPFPDCGKNVDIIEPFPTNQESSSQSSEISALTNRMNESLAILSSPTLRMEGVENTGYRIPTSQKLFKK
ncbi:16691_t:CDS:2 [Funneliformis geosporum]|nr:16691_t:CDS:2 [Funneliformis geosporum]